MLKSSSRFKTNGFSLLELILPIAIVAILAAATIPVYQSFKVSNDLALSVSTTTQALRHAQTNARAMVNDSSWGIYIEQNQLTLFEGNDYTGRTTESDLFYNIPGSVAPTGENEIVFDKMTGNSQTIGTITLSTSNESKQININQKGSLDF